MEIVISVLIVLIAGVQGWDEQDVQAIREKFIANARYDLPAEDDVSKAVKMYWVLGYVTINQIVLTVHWWNPSWT